VTDLMRASSYLPLIDPPPLDWTWNSSDVVCLQCTWDMPKNRWERGCIVQGLGWGGWSTWVSWRHTQSFELVSGTHASNINFSGC
jgi:hypothetical protein